MGVKLISSMFSFIIACALIFGVVYCFLKYFLKKKKTNSVKNRSNAAPNNIVHMNFPMSNTDAPFYVNNNEIVELPLGSNTGSNLNPNSENFGWRQEVLPNAPVNNDMNQPPPPYSSVVNNN